MTLISLRFRNIIIVYLFVFFKWSHKTVKDSLSDLGNSQNSNVCWIVIGDLRWVKDPKALENSKHAQEKLLSELCPYIWRSHRLAALISHRVTAIFYRFPNLIPLKTVYLECLHTHIFHSEDLWVCGIIIILHIALKLKCQIDSTT